MIECSFTNLVVVGSDMAPVLRNEFVDTQATIEWDDNNIKSEFQDHCIIPLRITETHSLQF